MSPRRDRSAHALAGVMALAGAMHFIAPQFYRPMIPEQLGAPDPWVYASGVAEIALAAAVAVPRTRRWGAYAMAGLFVAVFPGNVQMAVDAWEAGGPERALTLARLPLQVPLVIWAVRVGRRAGQPAAAASTR